MPADRLVVRGLRSVMVFCTDPATSCAWWAELLGAVMHEDGEFRWLDLPGGAELGFHPADEEKNPFGASTVAYWAVDSVGSAVELVTRAGGSLHRGPLPVSAGRTIAQVRDPFGAVLGLDGGR